MFSPVFYIIGHLLVILGVTMLGPALLDHLQHQAEGVIFLTSSSITVFTGFSLIFAFKTNIKEISVRQAFLLTFLTWTILSGFAAIPFMLTSLKLTFTEAYFETMSGLTTTGSTIFKNLDHLSQGLHLWRAFLSGLGGIGIIVLAIAILPLLKIGGMQLFQMESSDKFDKFLPRSTQIAANIVLIYLGLILLCFFAYWFFGMSFFDAIFHSITTLATSGTSTHDQSFGYFNNARIEWVGIIFMLLGAMPFVLYAKFLMGNRRALLKDGEVQLFIGFICVAAILIFAHLFQKYGGFQAKIDFFALMRKSIFHAVSYMTTTGIATENILKWGSFPLLILLFLGLIGGCRGSTSGGLKVFRFRVLLAQTSTQIAKLIHPRGIFIPYFNNKAISPNILTSVSTFIFVYVLIIFIFASAYACVGVDFSSSLSISISTLSNTGQGLTEIYGPFSSFADLPIVAKWIMILGMLLGRLEIFSVLVVFLPFFWRN
ncbi:MAG: TrkH family potassium uptake protein [Alphaproteobacteria bacterium]|nr:TrkH family potassium uptake protein [Alphaproteobacteria bacterium]